MAIGTRLLIFTVTISLACASVQAASSLWPESVLVVTSDKYPVATPNTFKSYIPKITLLNLDSVSHIESRLSKGLPVNEDLATAEFHRRVESIGRSRIESELRSAYQAVGTAMAHDLDRYPAIIFDEELVVYGLTDLSQALDKYRQWHLESGEVTGHE
ncbi:hypothetical protein R50073_51280 (plasmid) [Maricurvus nonylphenolicus]|uniref:TIGR03757 family integrating conjugative element protein n=1 Tax=Maricurvus nonylphenolicus TaxID=1008307 RepID=UPI0036F2DC3D